ncbi:MAG: hypothetical protein ACI9XO_001352 [Paraglaciecola sp.]|jgi:hypothetical protein
MNKQVTSLFFLLAFSISGYAQLYTTALGLRMGTDWGFTVQQRVLDKVTIEGIMQSSLQREEVMITGMVQQHYPLITKGLNVYMGAGMHKGWNTSEPDVNQIDVPAKTDNPMGVSLVVGGELTLGRLNISYDFKPAFNLKGGEKSFYTQSGVSLRYVIVKNKVFKKMKKKRKKKKKAKAKAKRGDPKWMFWKK